MLCLCLASKAYGYTSHRNTTLVLDYVDMAAFLAAFDTLTANATDLLEALEAVNMRRDDLWNLLQHLLHKYRKSNGCACRLSYTVIAHL